MADEAITALRVTVEGVGEVKEKRERKKEKEGESERVRESKRE